jgi:hypothetical protein
MNHQDFINFLQKLKEQKISNGRLARYLGLQYYKHELLQKRKATNPACANKSLRRAGKTRYYWD